MIRSVCIIALLVASAPGGFAQKPKPKPPADGTAFKLAPDAPKWVTGDIEFRDPADEKWPNFFYGKPSAAGVFTWDAKEPKGTFAFTFDKMAQKQGDQDRKVLAELLKEGQIPAVQLAVKGFGSVTQEKDEKGKPVEVFPVRAALTLAGKVAEVNGTARVKWQYAKDAEFPEGAQLVMVFATTGDKLGLKSLGELKVTAFVTTFKDLPKKK
jgi:hypothetical protein